MSELHSCKSGAEACLTPTASLPSAFSVAHSDTLKSVKSSGLTKYTDMAIPALDKLPYTLANLPYGVVSTASEPKPRCAVAIGDHAIDLAKYAKNGNLFEIESGRNFMFQQMFAEV
jgi:hypothetical protein